MKAETWGEACRSLYAATYSVTANSEPICAYCNHVMHDCAVIYINGEPVCAMCRAKIEGLKAGLANS